MADQPVISIENLSKRYVLRHQVRNDTLRDALSAGVHGLWQRLRRNTAASSGREEFWALRDVSFEVRRGEVLGVIGRNGAGKSTLLKILSRITEPTTGRITLRGRVASLLEVGTGFHPELTGRENIFLNGAILGMRRDEIRRKFDEIVAFAEVERFLDTPVKRYSSGMYVRLAFAVAAHLEPEILIVDEVLAVGDIAFQKKCIGKMKSVAGTGGRTVLFVSHNIGAIRQLCASGLLLEHGRIQAHGAIHQVLNRYQERLGNEQTRERVSAADFPGIAQVSHVAVETLDGRVADSIPVGVPWRVRVLFHVRTHIAALVVAVGFKSSEGAPAQTAWRPPASYESGEYEAVFVQDRVVLEAGSYTVIVGLSEGDRSLHQVHATKIDIISDGAVGYFPVTSGVGMVLNSMHTSVTRLEPPRE